MSFVLVGLEATLSDENCDRVALLRGSGEAIAVFLRRSDDSWDTEGMESDPVHTQELLAMIGEGFGKRFDRVECCVGSEKTVHAMERGSVSVRRVPREKSDSAAPAAEVESKALAEALGIPASRRKAKFRQAHLFARIVERNLPQTPSGPLRLLDLACGRSYLGLVLSDLLSTHGRRVTLHGVDSNPVLVEKCRRIAQTLGWSNCEFETADLEGYVIEPGSCDVMVALHACDTLTDEALRIACRARTPLLFVAPCCQHEMRHLWKEHPLEWIARYGLLEQRLADVLTDGFRSLVLEALGYRVNVLRFTAPEITPKNLLIQARLTSNPRPERFAEAEQFLRVFSVRPRLASLLEPAR